MEKHSAQQGIKAHLWEQLLWAWYQQLDIDFIQKPYLKYAASRLYVKEKKERREGEGKEGEQQVGITGHCSRMPLS